MYILSILVILIILVTSPWTWEIFSFNIPLFLLLISASVFLYLSMIKQLKKLFYFYCLLLIPILIMQWMTTKDVGLNYISATDQHLFATRRYELSSIITPNLARYLGSKPEYIFYKFEQNLLRHMDLNLYFFGSHPRERVGIREFEKFSFLFLPFFVLGLLKLIKLSPGQIAISSVVPLLVLSFIGEDNQVGPFSLFPFFVVTIALGLSVFVKKILNIVQIQKCLSI